MTEPPTMLVREPEDDRTVVDPVRLGEPYAPFPVSGGAPTRVKPSPGCEDTVEKSRWPSPRVGACLRRHGRAIMTASLVLAALLGLGSVAHHQWRASKTLRTMLTELRAERAASRAEPIATGPLRPTIPDQSHHRSSDGVTPLDRDGAELRGVNLIVAHDFEAALPHYRTLTLLAPTEGAFRDFVTVLETKLNCVNYPDAASPSCR